VNTPLERFNMVDVKQTTVALVGCGFVADYYMATLRAYPWIRVGGVFDIDRERLDVFTSYYRLRKYESLDELLNDNRVSIVLNLTNPRSHYEISRRCLEAGRHVYSEKPLAMNYEDAESLVSLAESRGLMISSAPCSLLGNAAQTLWRGVRDGVVGDVRLVYAELDDGMVHLMPYKQWRSKSGAPWPYKDEFEVGCTLEHAGYSLSWLAAIFGPVKTVTAFSDCLIPNKAESVVLDPPDTPDITAGLLKFESGVVARLTTSIVGPHDHSIRVMGYRGVMEIDDCWFNDGKVHVRKYHTIRRKTFLSPVRSVFRVPGAPARKLVNTGGNRMDYAAGVAELAEALLQGRPCRLSPRFSLHVTEVSLALQGAGTAGCAYHTRSRFEPVTPLDWAGS
jgi:predicted dehydrogenase